MPTPLPPDAQRPRPIAMKPGPHGGDGRAVARALGLDPALVIDLSASLNPFAPAVTPLALHALGQDPRLLSTYPDPTDATAVLAAALGTSPERLILTNGGAEAIALVASTMEAGFVVEPEFSLYRRHLAAIRDDAARWRSNPSNPLGVLAQADEHAAVWDEAFYPLATGRWSRGEDESWRLGSLTKLWSCPGLRLGFVVAPDPVAAQELRHRQPRWAVNGLPSPWSNRCWPGPTWAAGNALSLACEPISRPACATSASRSPKPTSIGYWSPVTNCGCA